MKVNIDVALLDAWESQKTQTLYKEDEPVFTKGDPIAGLNIVQNGLIQLFYLGSGRRSEVIRFAGNGKIFGHVAIAGDHYPSSSMAKEETLVCHFSNELFLKMNESNPRFCFDLISYYSKQHNQTVLRLIVSAQMNLREKVANALLYLYQEFGVNGNAELRPCFSREDIASLAGTTQEQVSRQLSDFEKDGIISKRARHIAMIAPDKLKSIINSYYANNDN